MLHHNGISTDRKNPLD